MPRAATFLGSHGNNQFYIATSVFSGSLYAEFGLDRDLVSVKSCMLLGNTTFVTGSGGDRIDLSYSFGRFVSANTGATATRSILSAAHSITSMRRSATATTACRWLARAFLYPFTADGGAGRTT